MQKLMLILASTAMLCSCRETYTIAYHEKVLNVMDTPKFHIHNDSLFFKDKNFSEDNLTFIKRNGIKYRFSGAYDYSIAPEPPNILFVFECSIVRTPCNKLRRTSLKVADKHFKAIKTIHNARAASQPACCCTNH